MAPAGCAEDIVNKNLTVYLKLEGTLDTETEYERCHVLFILFMLTSFYLDVLFNVHLWKLYVSNRFSICILL